ncbi:hypothetical protein FVE85_3675 [Porphyridium purpureum]|uniref:Uncharacterized protein n=1 Tax=Porphyridium purpureum TaxID=35688 RepID=A0A5J4YP97_PORPP|nr:hypothetical protein FVE85_3675 [Porphyridium purpureum]|eukprot:POR5409..scf249_10
MIGRDAASVARIKLEQKACFEIRRGRQGFRGVVFDGKEYSELMSGGAYADVWKDSFEATKVSKKWANRQPEGIRRKHLIQSLRYFERDRGFREKVDQFESRDPGPPYSKRKKELDRMIKLGNELAVYPTTYAFRNGLNGARGLLMSRHVMQELTRKKVDAPDLETQVFNNTTQALVFCQLAGTRADDWRTLVGSLLWLHSRPLLRPHMMFDHYLMRLYEEEPKVEPFVPKKDPIEDPNDLSILFEEETQPALDEISESSDTELSDEDEASEKMYHPDHD